MKALIYRKFGDPGVLEWVDNWPNPVISPNSVLIKCIAGGVNPKDVFLRKGKFSRTLARDPLPRVTGLDIAGEVVEVGKGVSNFATGDVVFGMTNNLLSMWDTHAHAVVRTALRERARAHDLCEDILSFCVISLI